MENPQEKLADKVKRLAREIESANREISKCKHQYGLPIRATRDILVPYYDGLEKMGSDVWPKFRYEIEKEGGYERTCTLCGNTEYTTNTEPVIKEYRPVFKD